ncbi:MAG: molybdenum cofactor guanylyltransferase [Thermoplasmata archaeon]
MIALIPVGKSRRLKDKHFLHINEKRMIDYIVDKIMDCNFFDDIVVISYKKIEIKNAVLIIDNDLLGVSNAMKQAMEKFDNDVFLIGGDMPFVSCESISMLFGYPGSLISIPRWSTGYFEPLHAFYPRSITFPERKDMRSLLEKNMFVSVRAENFPEYTFFNINTKEDYITAVKLLENPSVYGELKSQNLNLVKN